jgi:phosphoserine phosphatase
MQHILTLIAAREHTSLDSAIIAEIRDRVEGGAPTILSDAEAVEIPCPAAPDLDAIRQVLAHRPIDALASSLATERRKRLLIADMDSTIVASETLDELAAHAGLYEEIAAITARSMNGEIDFSTALRERVAMLRGLALDALDRTWAETRLTGGARELVGTMRAHGAITALVSGGFTFFTSRVAEQCGFHLHRANILIDDGIALTGTVQEPILDRDSKCATLLELAATHTIPLSATLAIGDGANDLAMLAEAGLGIAFRAKPVVAATARHRVDYADLRAILFAQGYFAGEFKT